MKEVKEERLIKGIISIMQKKALRDWKSGTVRRSAHAKTLGLVKGTLSVNSSLPQDLRIGLFKEAKDYPILIRFSSSSSRIKKDSSRDVRGMAVKILADGHIQDLILVSTKHMPLRNLESFYSGLCMMNGIRPVTSFFSLTRNMNWKELLKLIITMKHEVSPLNQSYYSLTAYRYGRQLVKYCVIPEGTYKKKRPLVLSDNYLRENMKAQLKRQGVSFDLMVQFQKEGMSIEDISQEWNEEISPYIKVGEIHLKPQIFDTVERKAFAEELSFSPAHALPQHAPVGSLNGARAIIYNEMNRFRKCTSQQK